MTHAKRPPANSGCFNGGQKVLVGTDFALGASGDSEAIHAVYDHLAGQDHLTGTTVLGTAERFVKRQLTPRAAESLELVAIVGDHVLRFALHTFRTWRRVNAFSTLGSGAELVHRALTHVSSWGVGDKPVGVGAALVEMDLYMTAATESSGVDDQVMAAFLVDGRAYALAPSTIRPRFFPPRIVQRWSEVTSRSAQIFECVRSVRMQIRMLEKQLSPLRFGLATADDFAALERTSATLRVQRASLAQLLQAYRAFYDAVIGGTALGTRITASNVPSRPRTQSSR